MLRYEGDKDNSSRKNFGFDYYIEQLHQISIERKSVESEREVDQEEDEERLDIFAKLLRLLWHTGDIYLETFFSEAHTSLGVEMSVTYPALQRMQAAGLVAINEGKVILTASGKDLMEEL